MMTTKLAADTQTTASPVEEVPKTWTSGPHHHLPASSCSRWLQCGCSHGAPLHKEELHADGRFWLFSTNKAWLVSARRSHTCFRLVACFERGQAVFTHMKALESGRTFRHTSSHSVPNPAVSVMCSRIVLLHLHGFF